jgi:hypothetical protein
MNVLKLVVAAVSGLVAANVNQSEVTVYVGDKEVGKGITRDGTVYVPVRAVGQALGAEVEYGSDGRVELTPRAPLLKVPDGADLEALPLKGAPKNLRVFVHLNVDKGCPSLSEGSLRDAIEVPLRAQGFGLAESGGISMNLEVTVTAVHSDDAPVSGVLVAVDAEGAVVSEFDRAESCITTLWSAQSESLMGDVRFSEGVREVVVDKVAAFMNCYLKVNPVASK